MANLDSGKAGIARATEPSEVQGDRKGVEANDGRWRQNLDALLMGKLPKSEPAKKRTGRNAAFNNDVTLRDAARERMMAKKLPPLLDDEEDEDDTMADATPIRKPAVAPAQANEQLQRDQASKTNAPDLEEHGRRSLPLMPTLSTSRDSPPPASIPLPTPAAASTTSNDLSLDQHEVPPPLTAKEQRKLQKRIDQRAMAMGGL